MFQFILNELDRLGISLVLAAGNVASEVLQNFSPQRFGGPTTSLIIVGGTNRDGTLWPHTRSEGSVIGGISTSALADQVETASADAANAIEVRDGTSFAAPVVAALAAYYLSFPQLRNDFQSSQNGASAIGRYSRALKNYLVLHSHPRAGLGFSGPIVAWNQAVPGAQCPVATTTPLRRSVPMPTAHKAEKRDSTLGDWDWQTSTIVSSGVLVATDYASEVSMAKFVFFWHGADKLHTVSLPCFDFGFDLLHFHY